MSNLEPYFSLCIGIRFTEQEWLEEIKPKIKGLSPSQEYFIANDPCTDLPIWLITFNQLDTRYIAGLGIIIAHGENSVQDFDPLDFANLMTTARAGIDLFLNENNIEKPIAVFAFADNR